MLTAKVEIPATKVLIGISFVRKLILENRTQKLYKATEIYNAGLITYNEALDKATNHENYSLNFVVVSN